jgi:hypothetical protein
MAYSTNSPDHKASWNLTRGIHYVVSDGTLYLDLLVAYPQYQRFKQGSVEGSSIRNAEAFQNVVRSMAYFNSESAITEYLPTSGRPVLALSMEAMQEAGIPTQMFI